VRSYRRKGLLRSLDPLALEELQQVTVTISDPAAIDDDLAGYFTPDQRTRSTARTLI
jgi:hypothetical protein